MYAKGFGAWRHHPEFHDDSWQYLVLDDWPLKRLEADDTYKKLMNSADPAALRGMYFDGILEMKQRPCILLFNPPAYDSPNSMDWDWVNSNAVVMRLDGPLF